jgi:mediator of RNA polymerase II transcription subunit 7
MMQSHLDHTRAETAAIRAEIDKAKQVLEGLGSIEVPSAPSVPEPVMSEGELQQEVAESERVTRGHEVWLSADSLF